MRTLLVGLLAALLPPAAFACVIDEPDEPRLIKEATAIFEGVLLEEDTARRETVPNTYFVVRQTFRVEVGRVWKGQVPRQVVVSGMDVVEQCVGSRFGYKYEPILFKAGNRVVIYARETGPGAYAMLRFGYFAAGLTLQPSLLYKTYGQGTPP